MNDLTFDFLEKVILQCAKTHECDPLEVIVFEVKLNERYDPAWKPFRELGLDRMKDPQGWSHAWAAFNWEGKVQYLVDLIYPNTRIPVYEPRAIYGVNPEKDVIELWMD